MAADSYDALASVLRELPGRFGAAIFSDRRRVVSVLSDRVPEARREIKVLGSAIDDGVFDALSNARPEQIGLEIDRLAARIETNLGIRGDIALPVIRACAHGLGRGPLPSEYGRVGMGQAMPAPGPRLQPQSDGWVGVSTPVGAMPPDASPSAPIPRHQPDGSWVGVSTPVGAQAPYPPQGAWASAGPVGAPQGGAYAGGAYPGTRPTGGAKPEWVKWALIGVGALVGIVALVLVINSLTPTSEPDPRRPDQKTPGTDDSKPPPRVDDGKPPARVDDRKPPPRVDDGKPPPRVDDGKPPPGVDTTKQRDPKEQGGGGGGTKPQPPPTQLPPTPGGTYGEETADFGISPQRTLQTSLGTPTPTTIPVGRILLTREVYEEVRKGTDFLLVDVLDSSHPQTILKARYIPYAGRPGNFNDQIQQQVASDLAGLTRNRPQHPIVFFCASVRCWESYNAVLRAYEAGYRNLYWYRGGIAAWQAAGLPMQPLGR